MDKAQKRLVDTYFRKRTIASNQGYDEFDYKKYELNYWYVHYPEEFKKLDYQQMRFWPL